MKNTLLPMWGVLTSLFNVVVATGLTSIASTCFANDLVRNASIDTLDRSALFDNSRSFVPPTQLPYATTQYRNQPSDTEIARQLRTISITPDGVVETLKARRIDIEIFKQALLRIDRAAQERGAGEITSERNVLHRSVIGRDTRQQIARTIGYPYRAIGHLENGCTGTLVGPRHVLTAGHCVYNISTDRWYSRLDFTPGRSGTKRPYGGYEWSRALSINGWIQNKLRSNDYGMVVLNQDLGRRVGWMAFGWHPRMPKYKVNIVGFPADKRPRHTMWASSCKLQRILSTQLYYSCDTNNGMSGSPVYVYWSSNRRRMIYGIHAYGVDRTGMNGATRITRSIFNTMRRWKSTY